TLPFRGCLFSPGSNESYRVRRALVEREAVPEGDALAGRMPLLLDEPPLAPVDLREEGVARNLGVDEGEVEAVGPRQGRAIDLGAAGDEHLRARGPLDRLLDRRRRGASGGRGERAVPRHHDDRAAGERPAADRLEGLPP